jgi:hypothetical protein
MGQSMEGINIPQGSVVISIEEYNRYREIEANQDMIIVKDHYSAYKGITFVGKDEAIKRIQDSCNNKVSSKEMVIMARNETIGELEKVITQERDKYSNVSLRARLHFLFTGKLETK